MDERKAVMRKLSFEVAMEGVRRGRKGQCHFVFFDTEHTTGTVFESIEFSDDWENPGWQWYPGPPPNGAEQGQILAG